MGWVKSHPSSSATAPAVASVVGSSASRGARNAASSLRESIWMSCMAATSRVPPSATACAMRSLIRWLRAPYDQSSVMKYGYCGPMTAWFAVAIHPSAGFCTWGRASKGM